MTGSNSNSLCRIGLIMFILWWACCSLPRAAMAFQSPAYPHLIKKAVPALTLEDLSPPFLQHAYFEQRDQFPFEPDATAFSLANAWWLAEASTLAYADEAFATPRFKGAGLDEIRFFSGPSTQCYVASNRLTALVAFRGSEVWKRKERPDEPIAVADFMTNLDFRLTDWPGGVKVHRGFKNALEEVWGEVYPYLTALQARGCRIWMTGHSLGAALATLAADRYGAVQGVYTFGSPRVGNNRFRDRYAIRSYRFVNGKDIVTKLPPPGFYAHVGELKFIDHEGRILDRTPATELVYAGSQGERGETVPVGNGGETKTPVFMPDAVIDHVPVLYAIMIWNRLVESRVNAQ